MKTVGLMQPYLFPYIGYFQLMKLADQYVFYDDVQFIKGGWINRNNILINGQRNLFTIRLQDASPNKLINEIDISDDFSKFLKTVNMAYAKAPHNTAVMKLLQEICGYEDKNLAAFTANSLRKIAGYIGFETLFTISSELMKDNNLRGQEKVIAICKELEGDRYINAIGGQELYSRQDFENEGIELKFVQTKLVPYKQLKNEFVPYLSIIDVLMFNSVDETNKLLDEYELV